MGAPHVTRDWRTGVVMAVPGGQLKIVNLFMENLGRVNISFAAKIVSYSLNLLVCMLVMR